jgi:pyruvate dehydrogenase E2 component (dihydrolipoamide acetyltransferase)
MKDLTNKAKTESLSLEDVSGGTFTISNLGMFGVDDFKPIINPPQAAILGVGTITDKPVAADGKVVIRPMTTLTLVFDHRIFDGVTAALFLRTLRDVLERFPQYVEL